MYHCASRCTGRGKQVCNGSPSPAEMRDFLDGAPTALARGMTTERIAALLVALVVAAAPSFASAQHESPSASDVSAASQHGVHLREQDEVLTPPSAGEYVLPVLGIVVGAALVVGGALSLLISGLSAIGDEHSGHTSDATMIYLGIGLGGVAVGAVSIIASVLGLSSLRHRARESEGPNLLGVALAPTEGGVALAAWGTF